MLPTVPLKVKLLHPKAQLPRYATPGSACLDFFLPFDTATYHGYKVTAYLGLSIEVPEGHVLLLFSRSGHGFNHGVRLSNCVGVIDSDYRGDIKVSIHKDTPGPHLLEKETAVVQGLLLPVPRVEVLEVPALSITERGENGFGSTDKTIAGDTK